MGSKAGMTSAPSLRLQAAMAALPVSTPQEYEFLEDKE
jgi:hypothetical protein